MPANPVRHQQHLQLGWPQKGRSRHHAGTHCQPLHLNHDPRTLLLCCNQSRLHCRFSVLEGQELDDHESSRQRWCPHSHVPTRYFLNHQKTYGPGNHRFSAVAFGPAPLLRTFPSENLRFSEPFPQKTYAPGNVVQRTPPF